MLETHEIKHRTPKNISYDIKNTSLFHFCRLNLKLLFISFSPKSISVLS